MDPLRRHRGAPATQRTQRGRASGISRSLVLIGTLVLLLAAVLPPGALHASQSQVERASEP